MVCNAAPAKLDEMHGLKQAHSKYEEVYKRNLKELIDQKAARPDLDFDVTQIKEDINAQAKNSQINLQNLNRNPELVGDLLGKVMYYCC